MSFRIWLFVASVSALLAVAAAAYGAHALPSLNLLPNAVKSYDTAQNLHMVHSLALFGIAVTFAATETRRSAWASLLLHVAAAAFLVGILLFSGGIYQQVLNSAQSLRSLVPVGGVSFMVGWAALALSAFGFRSAVQD
ncbi:MULTISPECIES: DUF423 domain-containing protein [Rhodomicrobium]|uniref:DUF423 domain-containing protein n=1 Tax=Rhodomicrobium TaxID=1068 RepID=UPI000B4B6D2E|nr:MULTISPECIES: DUF423 domain-containing protein [Rhodomicrobium]